MIFSIFARSVGVNQRSLRTTAFGIFLVTVSTHGAFSAEISLATLFLSHSVPHFTSACQYFPALLTIPPIAGAITFEIIGHATAPVTPPSAHPVTISHMVACHPLSIIGCAAPNHAPTTPDRRASHPTHLAQATYHPPIGAVSASSPPVCLAFICF